MTALDSNRALRLMYIILDSVRLIPKEDPRAALLTVNFGNHKPTYSSMINLLIFTNKCL